MRVVPLLVVVTLAACAPGADGAGHGGTSSSSGAATGSSSSSSSSSSGSAVAPPQLPALLHTTVAQDVNPDPQVVEVDLVASVVEHAFADGRLTQAYAYNGLIPGPTLQLQRGQRLLVHFTNQLPEPTTIHWHGLRIPDTMDGTPMTQTPVPPGGSFTYDFTPPDAGNFWYHPHYNTPQQMERGLMGAVVVHEDPAVAFDAERIIFTDDVRLEADGSLAPFQQSGMDVMHGRGGNVLLLNGAEAPRAPVTVTRGTQERWRVFNGANARTMSLSVAGATFAVFGTDGGPLPRPRVRARLSVAAGERYDVLVYFDGAPGSTAALLSHVLVLDGNGNVVEEERVLQEFQVATAPDAPLRDIVLPSSAEVTLPPEGPPDRTLVISGYNDGTVHFTINGRSFPDEEAWETTQGTTAQVRIDNQLGMEHPFHFHGQFFRVLAPAARVRSDPGVKDTVLVAGGETVTVLVDFSNPGHWMYHCHILEHAEAGMGAHVTVHPDGSGHAPGTGH
ncbi:MAG: multicopper oxidase family protein [Deltaproteobacteria bacterium]|nr:multicopper oxidase family protein [Deltaproteobacteria bacterium]